MGRPIGSWTAPPVDNPLPSPQIRLQPPHRGVRSRPSRSHDAWRRSGACTPSSLCCVVTCHSPMQACAPSLSVLMPRLGCLIGAVGGDRAIPSVSTGPRPSPMMVAEISTSPPSTACSISPRGQTPAAALFCSIVPSGSYAVPDQSIDICEVRIFLLLPFLSPTLLKQPGFPKGEPEPLCRRDCPWISSYHI